MRTSKADDGNSLGRVTIRSRTPEGVERFRLWVAAAVGIGLLLVALGIILSHFSFLAVPLVVAGIVVMATDPVITWMSKNGIRRGWATLLVMTLSLGLTTLLAILVAPALVTQWEGILETLPVLWADTEEWLLAWGQRLAIDMERVLAVAMDLLDRVFDGGGGVSWGQGVFAALVALLFGLVLGAAAVLYLPSYKRATREAIPEHLRPQAVAFARDVGGAVIGFIRGQLVIALIVGLLISVGLALLGIPFWLVLGSIAGIGNLVPFLGPVVGGVPATFIALAYNGIGSALAAVALMVVVQLVESYVLSPLILYRTVRIRPIVIILAIMIGWSTFGLLGVLLAVPVAAMVKVAGRHVLSWTGVRPLPDP